MADKPKRPPARRKTTPLTYEELAALEHQVDAEFSPTARALAVYEDLLAGGMPEFSAAWAAVIEFDRSRSTPPSR
jgi:hypothetical protein